MLLAGIIVIALGILLIAGGIFRTPKQHRSTDYSLPGDDAVGCLVGTIFGLVIHLLPWPIVRIIWIVIGTLLVLLGYKLLA